MSHKSELHDLDWYSLIVGVFVTLCAVAAWSKGWTTDSLPWLELRYLAPGALLLLGALGLVRSLRGDKGRSAE